MPRHRSTTSHPASGSIHSTHRARRWLELIALLAIVALGVALRWEPVRRAGGADFDFDRAFHFRLTRAVVETGAVPQPDPLGLPPDGKPVTTLLPTLLYDVVATLHRWRGGDLTTTVLLFGAFAGGLIALPIFGVARGLGLGALPALIAALAAVICPAHVHRTTAHWLRYDALGILLVTTHLAALVLLFHTEHRRLQWLGTAVAALALGAAVAAWRVPLALAVAEGLIVLTALAGGKLGRWRLHRLAGGLLAVIAVAAAAPYLAHAPSGHFLLSRTGLMIVAAAALIAVDGLAGGRLDRQHGGRRVALVLGILLCVLFAGRASPYDALSGALGAKLGRADTEILPDTQIVTGTPDVAVPGSLLFATTGELASPALSHLMDADYFALLLPLALLYPLLRLLRRGRRAPLRPPPDALWLWHLATLLALVLTLLFARTKALAGPLLALYPALLIAMWRDPAWEMPGPRWRDGWRGWWSVAVVVLLGTLSYAALRHAPIDLGAAGPWLVVGAIVTAGAVAVLEARRGARRAPIALIVIGLLWTGAESRALVGVLGTRLPPTTARAIDLLRQAGRPGDVVLTDWGRGYVVQLYAGMPTVTDGLLESVETRRRIGGFARALYAEDETALTEFCRALGVRYLWIPGRRRQIYARYAGVRYADYFSGGAPTARGRRTNFAKLLHAPAELESFRPVGTVDRDRFYVFEPAASGSR